MSRPISLSEARRLAFEIDAAAEARRVEEDHPKPKRITFGFQEAIEFLREQDDPRFAAIEALLLEQKSKLARQHEHILRLEGVIS